MPTSRLFDHSLPSGSVIVSINLIAS
jgi:hypothetical protein